VLARRQLIPLACAVAALATAAVGVVASLDSDGWNTTGLVQMWDALPLAKLAVHDQPTFRLRGRSGHYDGAFFYAVARDPLAIDQAHTLVSEAPYYWGHPAYGWLAWLASAGGTPTAVPDALLAVGLLSIFIAGAAASLLAGALGWSRWGGLVVAFNPGLVFAVYSDTSEPLGAALLLLALAAYAGGHRRWALTLFAALCFDKEPLILVPLAIAAWELWRMRRLSFIAAAVIPVALWWLYLRIHLGAFPFGYGGERLTWPFVGWTRGLLDAAAQTWSPGVDAAQLGQAAVALIIVVGVAILVAALYALRLSNVVAPAFLALAGLYACITPNGVQYPKDLIREVALVLTLVPFAIAAPASPRESASARKYPRVRLPSRQRSGS
jgi:hypothetical protein